MAGYYGNYGDPLSTANNAVGGSSFGTDLGNYQTAGNQYNTAMQAAAQQQMAQTLFGGNYQRAGLQGQIGAMGGGRSALFGGAPAQRLQQFDTGLGSQIGGIATNLNQQLNQNQLMQQQTVADAQMQALQQQMWQQAQTPGIFDWMGAGLSAATGLPGLGQGLKALGI